MAIDSPLLLHDLFDRDRGWPYPEDLVAVHPLQGKDGYPYYLLVVDGFSVLVSEGPEQRGKDGSVSIPASRLHIVVLTKLADLEPSALVRVNALSNGFPSWGIDDSGDASLRLTLPFVEGFPLGWLRSQMLVSIGVAVESLREVLVSFDPERAAAHHANVAGKVAQRFARAFVE